MLSDKLIEYVMKKFFFAVFSPIMFLSSGVWIFLLLHYDRKAAARPAPAPVAEVVADTTDTSDNSDAETTASAE